MKKNKIKWGILSTGRIAHTFATALQVVPDSVLYAVGSRNTESALKFASEFSIPKAYGRYEDLVNNPEIDIIYIATPYNLHLENTLHALNHNKHVLCEKPMGINQREESIMIEKTKEKLTPLFISSIKRTHFIGILMFLSCLVTALFYKQYLTSVWCFFAA